MIEVPPVVENKARSAGATAWLSELPELVARLERDWAITVGGAFEDATEAFVAEATLGDGTPAALKLIVPRAGDAARHEITALRLAEGEGCVRLLKADVDRGALLLERLGPPLSRAGLGTRRRHEILVDLAERVWRPAPGCGLPTGRTKAAWLADFVVATWEELDRPCSERVVEHARSCAEARARAHDDDRAVLVHGDVHQWNALRAGGGYKLVDPDGLLAEPEYDLGIVMREDPEELAGDGRGRSGWLAARTGLDERAIWEWGVVERVSTGLLATRVALQPAGAEMLAAAERVARRRTG